MTAINCTIAYSYLLDSRQFSRIISREFNWCEDVHIFEDPLTAGYILRIGVKDGAMDYRFVAEDF